MLFIPFSFKSLWAVLFILCCFSARATLNVNYSSALTIHQAINIAQQNDPWLVSNEHQQRSIEYSSIAANTLPDPKVSIDLINLPTDGFNTNQEPITQFKVGLTQVFPRGKSLLLNSKKLKLESEAYPFQRQNREAKITVTVGKLWLTLYKVNQSIDLIEKHGVIFEQLIDIIQANYSSTLGTTRQQDIIHAQLELTRLEERLNKLEQYKKHYEGLLFQWLTDYSIQANTSENKQVSEFAIQHIVLKANLPEIKTINVQAIDPPTINNKNGLSIETLTSCFFQHPAIMAINKKIQATQLNVKLTQQKYKPEWEIGASYGHRRNDLFDTSRADLLSVGITFDLPLFTHNKQDKQVMSAVAHKESVTVEKHLLIRKMLSMYATTQGSLQRLKERQTLYASKLLPQVNEQSQALLKAYTNDDGQFTDVIRSHLSLLNAEIDLLTVNVEEQQLNLTLNYLFTQAQSLNTAANILPASHRVAYSPNHKPVTLENRYEQ